MKLKFTSLFITVAIGTLTLSCSKSNEALFDQTENISPNTLKFGDVPVQIKDGRLSFSDTIAFKKALFTVDKADKSLLDSWAKENNFISLYQVTDDISKGLVASKDEKEKLTLLEKRDALAHIEDISFTRLLNKDGFIQVGETVYRYTADDQVLQSQEANVGLLAGSHPENNPQVKVQRVTSESITPEGDIISTFEDTYQVDGDHRFIYGHKKENYALFSTAIALTQFLYKQTNVLRPTRWLEDNTANVSLNISYARVYENIAGSENWIIHQNVSTSATGSTSFRLGYVVGPGAVDVPEIHASHSASWQGRSFSRSY